MKKVTTSYCSFKGSWTDRARLFADGRKAAGWLRRHGYRKCFIDPETKAGVWSRGIYETAVVR